jgi:hypothetical protein
LAVGFMAVSGKPSPRYFGTGGENLRSSSAAA